MIQKLFYLIVISSFLIGCNQKTTEMATLQLIPEPQTMEVGTGSFMLTSETTLYASKEVEMASTFLEKYLSKGAGIGLQRVSEEKNAAILFKKVDSLPAEGYSLIISEENITISYTDAAGAFYGVQTLRQLLPPELERINSMPSNAISIPQVTITDAPKFLYRGMHLDVSRHFFPKEFIKEYISHLAMLKMNYFHWHLTDDQGWRIEIKEYPKLTTHAAYRNQTLVGHYNTTPQQYDGKRYGGYYTQEEVKEIVAFAAQHNVTIIPEIEMPGHAQAAVSAYPELGCTGDTIPVATKWGVFENIYCPNQKTIAFLKNVLTEVMELFPGAYIHIGGDEAPKTQWKTCAHCKQLIKKHNLKDEQGLQSWFIKEMEAFVNSKGKKIIGWDEILEGGLAPNATVMSWRGTQGAVEAAKEGHDVILTPTSHAYFDYYQDDHPDEPLAIGGFLPLEKVYSFNPIPDELVGAERDKVLGAQGNIWTEYIKTKEQVEYMAFPRILAMAEVVWSGPTDNLETDYPEFLKRTEHFMERLEVLNVNYANHLYDLEGSVVKNEGNVLFELQTPISGKTIKYKLNGASEETYERPIALFEDTQITAQVYKEGKAVGRAFTESITFHKGITGTIAINAEPHPAYGAGGKEALNNGVAGSDTRYGDKEWLGFWGDDLEITIHFDKTVDISKISMRFYDANGQWIYAPKEIRVLVKHETAALQTSFKKEGNLVLAEIPVQLRDNKIVLRIPSYGTIPDGLQGAGNKAWTFIDEIVIE